MAEFLNFLSMAGSFIFMIIFFGACVFFHELGHFLAAKWRGLHIDAFSIGFKKAWGKKINGVDYRIGYLPLGGYVELPQVDSSQDEITAADGTVLPRAKALDRLITAFAGPFFNILFGLLLGCLVWYFGVPQDSPKLREFTVSKVEINSPEYNAGLREGDIITKLNNKSFQATWAEFAKDILLTVGDVSLEVKRGNDTQVITYTPKVNPNAPGKLKYEKIAWPFFEAEIPLALFPAPNSAAEKAGIRKNDLLVSVNGQKFNDYKDFFSYITFSNSNTLDFVIKRDGEIKKITAVNNQAAGKKYLNGFSYSFDDTPTIVGLIPDFPALKAGLKLGDVIIKVDDVEITDSNELNNMLQKSADKTKKFTVKRGEEIITCEVTPIEYNIYDWGLGISLIDHPTPIQQFTDTLDMSIKGLQNLIVALGKTLHLTETNSSVQLRHMSGPLGIADTLYNAVYMSSIMTGIYFVVIISFALAIFNLMPLPVLDGGHIVFALIEIIFRRPIPAKIIRGLSMVFIVLLIALMVCVTFWDIVRIVPDKWRDKINNTLDGTAKTEAVETSKNNNGK
ncbi:MAG: RIP metalloprotease RseP [Lentisphaeria bacterium]|nr:RIP metalloprotease RseP [Lentisphaeria bacterium]